MSTGILKATSAGEGVPVNSEQDDLLVSLKHVATVISESSDEERRRIATAYQHAQTWVACMRADDVAVWPRILACLEKFRELDAAGKIEASGWMLTAIEQRLDERDVSGDEEIRRIALKAAVFLTPASAGSLH